MHIEVRQFIKRIRKEYPHKFRLRDVLEVGALNINGSPRRYFWFCNYVGIDLMEGNGVDFAGTLWQYPKSEKQFDVVISTEMLEHDAQWRKSLQYMYKFLKSGGLMIITCASDDRMEHGTARTTPYASPATTDYYRNISKEDFKSVLPENLFTNYVLMNARDKQDLQFYGIKK